MEAYRHVPGFLAGEELDRLAHLIGDHEDLYIEVHGRGGLGPRYRVIDGDQILAELPAVAELGQTRVRSLAEEFAGRPLVALRSSKRAMRVQVYARREHGFRWHFDGHDYVALVALENGNGGQTHFMSRAWSRWLRFLLYPLYPLPQVLSLFPYRAVTMAAGDLLVMNGNCVLHRGVTRSESGRRVLFAYTFDPPDKRPSRLRDFVARRLNY